MAEKEFLEFNRIMQHVWLIGRLNLNILKCVQESIAKSLAKVTQGLADLGDVSAALRQKAETSFEKSYLDPDLIQASKHQEIQDQVDAVLNQLNNGEETGAQQINQIGSEYNKGLEAVSILDQKVSAILFDLMGALSADDVIGQRIACLIAIIRKEQEFIKNFLDFGSPKMMVTDLDSWCQTLHDSCRSFLKTAEDERVFDTSVGGKLALTFGNMDALQTWAQVLNYVGGYVSFNCGILISIEKLFAATIEAANNAIYSLDSSAQGGRDHAKSKVRRQASGDFASIVVDNNNHVGSQMVEEASDEVSKGIFEMMGVLSIGDVVGQRLGTTVQLSTELKELIDKFNIDVKSGGLQKLTEERIKESIKISKTFFTNETDKKIFNSIFNR